MEILTHGLVDSEVAEGCQEQITSNRVLTLKVAARALLFLESKLELPWKDCRGWLKVLEFSWQPCMSKESCGVVWACIWKKEPYGRGMVFEMCLRSVWVVGNLAWSYRVPASLCHAALHAGPPQAPRLASPVQIAWGPDLDLLLHLGLRWSKGWMIFVRLPWLWLWRRIIG